MKFFTYALLWISIWLVAIAFNVFLGDFLDQLEMARVVRSLIMALPTGLCLAIGLIFQNKLKSHFGKK